MNALEETFGRFPTPLDPGQAPGQCQSIPRFETLDESIETGREGLDPTQVDTQRSPSPSSSSPSRRRLRAMTTFWISVVPS